jgi:hypothetical protein
VLLVRREATVSSLEAALIGVHSAFGTAVALCAIDVRLYIVEQRNPSFSVGHRE